MKNLLFIISSLSCLSCYQTSEDTLNHDFNGFWRSGTGIFLVSDSIITHPYYDTPGYFNYKLTRDSLTIFDKCISDDEENFSAQVLSVGEEKLTLLYEKDTVNFTKINTTKPSIFKKVTFEAGMCFGTCPVFNVEINSDGNGVFNGLKYTKIKGLKKFTLNSKKVQEISQLLELVDIKNYPEDRFSPLPDDSMKNMTIEYENEEPIVIKGGLFGGQYYNVIKFFNQFETLLEPCS